MATKVEVGFELTVGDTPYFRLNDPVKGKLNNTSYRLAGPIWIDISDKVSSVSIKRGKNRELDRYSSAAASIALHNEDRTFDPLNTASPYNGNIIPRRSVRVSTAGVTQFTGVIEDWNLDYDVSGKSNAVIQAADAFTLLAQQSLTAGTATSQLTGARVNAVLSQPSVAWPLANRQIDVGNSLLGADVYSGNVLSYLQQIEASEQGQLFMSKGGDVRFVNGSTSRSSGTWTLTGTNLVTNPSMEAVSTGTVVMRRNLVTNPSAENSSTVGFTANDGSYTVAQSSEQKMFGTYSMKLTAISASRFFPAGYVAGANTVTATPDISYTFSVYVYSSIAQNMAARIAWLNGSTALSNTQGTFVSVAANTWTRVSVTGVAPATTTQMIPAWINQTSAAVGTVLYVDGLLLEASTVVGDYFDGSTTAAQGWTYAWSGTANASISTAACAATTVRTNLVPNPSLETNILNIASSAGTGGTNALTRETSGGWTGTSFARATWSVGTTAISGNMENVTSATTTVGATYTGSAYVRVNSAQRLVLQAIGTSVGTTTVTAVDVPANTWTRLSYTHANVTTAGTLNIRVGVSGGRNWVAGDTLDVDGWLLEASSTLGDYFDGSFQPAGDFSYAWTGTANASTSIQRGATPASWIADASTICAVRSQKYIGSQSVNVAPSVNNGGLRYPATTTVGTVYTWSAWVFTTVAKNMRVFGAGTGSSTTLVPANTWTRLSVTYTASATSSEHYVSGTDSTQPFYVDAVLLEASPIAGAYFDGSTTPADNYIRYAWTGTANASTSTKEQLIAEDILQFADDGTGIPYTNASVSYGTELLYNQVSVTYPGGTVTANNTASQDQYGISTTSVDTLLSNSTQAQTLADFWVTKYGQPEYRFQELTVNLPSLTGAQQAQILNSELGDIISVKFTPNGVGDPIERNGQIVAISHNIGIDRHDITYGFAAVPFTFFVLNDQGYGILDSSALAF